MTWYKESKDFSQKNLINKKIKFLKTMKRNLDYLRKYVFQNGSHTKKIILSYISDKKLSSYPPIRDGLIEASSIVLDSPHRFAKACQEITERIDRQIYTLRKERKEFDNPEKFKKGWY